MLFAINYSPQAAELVRAGRIVVDRFKCPDWPHLIAEARALLPVYVHFDLRAGGAPNGPIDWEPVEALRTSTVTPYVNLHLGPRPADFPAFPVETTDPVHVAAIAARLIEHVGAAVDRFGADRVIVENLLSAPSHRLMRPTILPSVIRQVVEETGCGFLLDISHARLAAAHLGMDAIDYLCQMPGERLREIHITGIAYRCIWRAARSHGHDRSGLAVCRMGARSGEGRRVGPNPGSPPLSMAASAPISSGAASRPSLLNRFPGCMNWFTAFEQRLDND